MAIMTLAGGALEAGFDLLAPMVRKEDSGSARPAGWLMDAFSAGPTAAGVSISEEGAMRLATVAACVAVLAESVAGLPLHQFVETDDGRERDKLHRNYALLHGRPNGWQTTFEWRELQMTDVLLTGNAYSFLEMDERQNITQILPLDPHRVTPKQMPSKQVVYVYNHPEFGLRSLPQSQVFHLRGKSRDGVTGISVIRAHREALGLAAVAEEFGGRFFSNGANMGGFFEMPPQMTDPAERANFIRYIQNRHVGIAKANQFGVLENGTKFHQTSISPEDAQFLELRKYQKEEICSIFRVPPHMVQDLSRSTNNNIEHQALEFVTHSLRPWLVRWEQALMRDMLGEVERRNRIIEHDVRGLLRGDLKSQAEYFSRARQWGWMSVNDIRRAVNDNTIGEQGDRYLEPVNMVPASALEQGAQA